MASEWHLTVQYNHNNYEKKYKHHKWNTKWNEKLKTALKMVRQG